MTGHDTTPSPDPSGRPLAYARGLVKRFGDFTAVAGIDFEVHRGEAFGFLGPNGAGKTSAMRMLGCTSPVTEGEISVFGLDPRTDGPAIRARLGVVAQMDNLDLDMTVEENIVMYGRYFGIGRAQLTRKVDELLDFAQLDERRHSRVDPLSGGMRRRLSIARALVNEPDLILLDEPTTGLDPQARQLLWEKLWTLKSEGVSLVVTTHYMDEAEQLCDRLVVMDRGIIVDEGSPSELIERHCPREVVEIRFATPEHQAGSERAASDLGLRAESLRDRLLVYTDDGDGLVPKLDAEPGAVESVLIRRAGLEDVFLTLTGRSLDDSMATTLDTVKPILRVTEREFRFFRSTWRATSFTLFGSPLLFLVALGLGLGGLIEDQESLGGLDYLVFIAPGLMVGAAAQLAAGSGLWPIMAGHRWLGFHRAMVATPIQPTSIVGGYLLWIAIRTVAQASVFLIVAAALGGIISGWAVLAVPVAALTAMAFAATLMAYTATCDSDKAFDPIMRIVIAPLFLFSGSFFATEALPQWLQWLVRVFPLWHGVELARAATTGQAATWPLPANLAVLLAWSVGGWYVARRTFTARLAS